MHFEKASKYLLVLVISCGAVAELLAQATGRLTGMVVDQSGGLLPGADVVATHSATGATLHTVTGDQGRFIFPDISIGSYELRVTLPGFDTLVRPDVEILTGRTMDLTLILTVGDITEEVEVIVGPPVVQTSSAEVQTTIDRREMEELPLNGRNALQLVVLTPGAKFTTAGTIPGQMDNTGVTINGRQINDVNFRLDGGTYKNMHYSSAPTLPNPDTLQEFTVTSSNYSAENSGAGGVVQLSTRSGTNNFHGAVFEFLRNDAFDARNFFDAETALFKRNQFGFTLGGPIVNNRLFFFGSYQGTRKRGAPSNKVFAGLPTDAQRSGDFSDLLSREQIIVDPLTGEPFPGNVIHQDRIDPISANLLPFIPARPDDGILTTPVDADQDDDQYLGKGDYLLSENNHLSARYFYDEFDFQRDTRSLPGNFALNNFRNQSVTVRDTHIISPTFAASGSFTYTRTFRDQTPVSPTTTADLGVDIPLANAFSRPELRINIPGYFRFFAGGPLTLNPELWEWRGKANWSVGNHQISFGLDVRRDREYTLDVSTGSGDFQFTGARTSSEALPGSGDAFADFLLGLPGRFRQLGTTEVALKRTKVEPWIQDDWKIAPNFTLNLGLRYSPFFSPLDTNGPSSALLPGAQSTIAPDAPTGMIFSGDIPGREDTLLPTDWNNMAPRIGFAWDLFGDSRTVIRGGYGMFYRELVLNSYRNISQVTPFRGMEVSILNSGTFQDPYADFPGGSPFPFESQTENELQDFEFVRPVSGAFIDPNFSTGYTQAWNVTVERELFSGVSLSVAYVGNDSTKELAIADGNPGLFVPGATRANIEERRLFPGIGSARFFSPFNESSYHGLQAQVRTRNNRGLSVVANYEYSRAIDIESGEIGNRTVLRDVLNPSIDRGRADFDARHRANISLLYLWPRFTEHRGVGLLLNGWQTNAIIVLESGTPFSVFSGSDNSLSGTGQGGAGDHADQVGDPARPEGVDKLQEFFNTAAFVPNALGTFGNSGRNILEGPGFATVDFAVFKNIPVTAGLTSQLRFEAFNLLNRANFGNPASTLTSSNFGRITSAGDPRVIQFGLKFLF